MLRKITLSLVGVLLSVPSWAEITGLRKAVYDTYDKISPTFDLLANGMSLLAGLGSLLYVAIRVYQMLMVEEEFSVRPILKPFCIGLLLMFYPGVINMLNVVGSIPTNYTNALVGESNVLLEDLIYRKVTETEGWKWYMGPSGMGDYDSWVKDNDVDSGPLGISAWMNFQGERIEFIFKQQLREFVFVIASIMFYVAALSVDGARVFFLTMLGLLGPMSIALSIFDFWSGSLVTWMTRYIHVYLWLPVANVYGFFINNIQITLIRGSFVEVAEGGSSTFSTTDLGMVVFMIFAALGYMTIPSVASWIVAPGHQGAAAMSQVNRIGTTMAAAMGAAAAGGTAALAQAATSSKSPEKKQHDYKLID